MDAITTRNIDDQQWRRSRGGGAVDDIGAMRQGLTTFAADA
jgi:hypothetical protein